MGTPYLELSYGQVALATLLILINGIISLLLKLGLERRLLVAAVCTVVQLLLIGLVLEWVFRVDRWYVVLAMMTAMTMVAGFAAIDRTTFRYPGIRVRHDRCNLVELLVSGDNCTGRDHPGAALVHPTVRHSASGDDPGQHIEWRLARARPAGK